MEPREFVVRHFPSRRLLDNSSRRGDDDRGRPEAVKADNGLSLGPAEGPSSSAPTSVVRDLVRISEISTHRQHGVRRPE